MGDAESEAGLVTRARAGDRGAFEALVTACYPALLAFCGSLTRDPERAQDLAQEATLRGLASIAAFRGESSFATWLRKIARNRFLNDRAKAAARLERSESAQEAPLDEGHASRAESPSAPAERSERARRVFSAVDGLPEDQRTALLLCDRDGLPYQEIATLMGTPLGTVMWRIHAARKRLRAALEGMDADLEGRPAAGAGKGRGLRS